MLTIARKRLEKDSEDGFTLIELMVVVLIIAILLAIAIPSFLGARTRANDRAAQSDLRNALTAEQTVFTDGQVYANSTDLAAVENNLLFTDLDVTDGATSAADAKKVQVALTTAKDGVCLTRISDSGKVYKIFSGKVAGTWYSSAASASVDPACPTADTTTAASAATFVRTGF